MLKLRELKIIVGSDHAGFQLKKELISHLKDTHEIVDAGCNSPDCVDYPDYARKVATEISSGNFDYGILICGSGIGMSITANRFKGIRAAVCHSVEAAKATRAHNNANILCLGSRTMDRSVITEIVDAFLMSSFDGGRHQRRLDRIDIS